MLDEIVNWGIWRQPPATPAHDFALFDSNRAFCPNSASFKEIIQQGIHQMHLISNACATAVLALAVVLFDAPERAALAEEYPDKTVRAIVPFGASGGASGTVGRKYMLSQGSDDHSPLFK